MVPVWEGLMYYGVGFVLLLVAIDMIVPKKTKFFDPRRKSRVEIGFLLFFLAAFCFSIPIFQSLLGS